MRFSIFQTDESNTGLSVEKTTDEPDHWACFDGRALALSLAVMTLTLSGCAPKGASSSSSLVSIRIPKADQQLDQKSELRGLTYDFSRSCFAITVSGPGISETGGGNCDIKLGLFDGFVAPEGTLSLSVPRGKDYKLDVFIYMRESDNEKCEKQVGFGLLKRSRIARAGSAAFDANQDEVTVNVALVSPPTSASVITQYSLSPSCLVAEVPAPSNAGFAIGHQRLTGGGMVIHGSLNTKRNPPVLSGGRYQIQLTGHKE